MLEVPLTLESYRWRVPARLSSKDPHKHFYMSEDADSTQNRNFPVLTTLSSAPLASKQATGSVVIGARRIFGRERARSQRAPLPHSKSWVKVGVELGEERRLKLNEKWKT